MNDLQSIFKPTNTVRDLEVDSTNKLFRIRNAKADFTKTKKRGLIKKAGNAAMAIGTMGMSSVAKATTKGIKKLTRKPDDIYSFNELVEFELLEDDSQVSSGGVGRALVGGVLAGGAGAIVGGVTGKKKIKRNIESLIIRITVDDLDNPIIMLPIITKKTKTSSKEYEQAFNDSQKIISTLNVIANNADEIIQKVEVIKDTEPSADPYEEIKKLKELLDMDIITQEEYEIKRKELLNV